MKKQRRSTARRDVAQRKRLSLEFQRPDKPGSGKRRLELKTEPSENPFAAINQLRKLTP